MSVTYELWDTDTRNRIAVFGDRATALAAVRRISDTQGRALAESMILGTEDDDGDGEVIARGAGLVALAEQEAPPQSPTVVTLITGGARVIAAGGLALTRRVVPAPRSGAWMKRTSAGKAMQKRAGRAKGGRVHNTDRSTGKTYKEPSGKKDGR